eukprot:CAMPEP_0197457084 /NCGR_PEP_ID=MMETSP1175-20131217/45073_1 /TAXON_ID=1003142 /ORGANISM="Triceratium dubium, Strain CCMP147" /LENGTH=137 /DNA_ID=CAMNT_0042991341 /DNA_START=201 /DNA_END=614 /DNA_ORIENTATION=+
MSEFLSARRARVKSGSTRTAKLRQLMDGNASLKAVALSGSRLRAAVVPTAKSGIGLVPTVLGDMRSILKGANQNVSLNYTILEKTKNSFCRDARLLQSTKLPNGTSTKLSMSLSLSYFFLSATYRQLCPRRGKLERK